MRSNSKVRRPSGTSHTKRQVKWSRANCYGMGDTLFFDQSEINERAARAICARKCPIYTECLMYGMTQAFGMWGGMTDEERRSLHALKTFVTCRQCGGTAVAMRHTAFDAEVCPRCGVWWKLHRQDSV